MKESNITLMDVDMMWMRRLVYFYFFLLIFEGALRKWIVPSLAAPLLIVRDPVLLAIYTIAVYRGIFPWTRWVLATLGLCAACVIASSLKECPPAITIFGVRSDFWQIPLIFVMPAIMDGDAVRRIGRWMLAILPGMALLALLQFRAGPDHWLNATTGGGSAGEQSKQLFAAAGRVRPSGTFSFVTGMVSLLTLGGAYVIESFVEQRTRARVWIAMGAMVLALGISGSRSAILGVGIVAIAAALTCLENKRRLQRVAVPLAAAVVAYAGLHVLSDFRAGLDVNRSRFDQAGGLQQGIVNRWFGDFLDAWNSEREVSWLGSGLGMGTNVGAGLSTGTRQFLLAEGEWSRVILESGPVLGPLFIALRLWIALTLLVQALRALHRRDDTLPLLLLAAGVTDLTLGQWGQSTISGFAVFTAGLCLASGQDGGPEAEEEPPPQKERVRVRRGRSVYAEAIKGGRR